MLDTADILMVEDEAAIRDMVRFALPSNQFTLRCAEHVDQALQELEQKLPDLILMDWMLPGKSGVALTEELKNSTRYRDIPIIMLTAKAEEDDKVTGLYSGVDDYVTKPFSPRELIARIQTVLRRAKRGESTETVTFLQLSLDMDQRKAMINNDTLPLTALEFRLLAFFLAHPKRTYSRDQLISLVWGDSVYIDERTVDVQIRRLRNCLKPYNYHHFIKTVRGVGYQFCQEQQGEFTS